MSKRATDEKLFRASRWPRRSDPVLACVLDEEPHQCVGCGATSKDRADLDDDGLCDACRREERDFERMIEGQLERGATL